jgi:hypothetical protein
MNGTGDGGGTVKWWKDKTILAALTPIVAVALKIVQINFGGWIAKHTGLAVNTWTAEDVLTYIGGLGVLVAGFSLIKRRIRFGKELANPAPLVTGGAIAQAVIGAVPVPPPPTEPPPPTPPADEYGYMAKEGALGQPTDKELLEAYKKRTNG